MAQFWQAYLLAYLFWLEIALGCLGFVMLHHVVGGAWSARIRRVMEAGAMTLPLMALLFIPLYFGVETLYPWANAAILESSELLQQKAAWLNTTFFLGRALFYWAIWLVLLFFLHRWSQEQDRTEGSPLATRLAAQMRRLSAIGLLLYLLTATFAAYDWVMSLEPTWFSSIYGLLLISGQGLSALCVAIIGLRWVARRQGNGLLWQPSFRHLGNWLLAFVLLWAYFAFSQFLVIWSANLPEETIWYLRRSQNGWLNVGLFLVIAHFALPFLLLLWPAFKRSMAGLTGLAWLLFLLRFVDLFYLVIPAFSPESVPIPWLALALWLVIGAGWITIAGWLWSRSAPLPLHDRHLREAREERQWVHA